MVNVFMTIIQRWISVGILQILLVVILFAFKSGIQAIGIQRHLLLKLFGLKITIHLLKARKAWIISIFQVHRRRHPDRREESARGDPQQDPRRLPWKDSRNALRS